MSARRQTPRKATPHFNFQARSRIPPILPSNILKAWEQAWGRGTSGFQPSPDLRSYIFDPAFHPATKEELSHWVLSEIEILYQRRLEAETRSGSREQAAMERALLDCEDSAFSLKSRASGLIRSQLSAPLCAGILACRTRRGQRDHVVNWFLSAEPDGLRPDGSPLGMTYELWFSDVRTHVEARLRRELGRTESDDETAGVLEELEQPFVPLSKAARCLDNPFLILA